jgi:hypothetical protein
MHKITLFLLAVILLAVGCNKKSVPPSDRPAGVPADARIDGAGKGSEFIKCSMDSAKGLNYCTVYDAKSGVILAQGHFSMPSTTPQPDVSDAFFVAFDGQSILVMNRPPLEPTSDVHGAAMDSPPPAKN